ncbi:hypothetical protein C8R46DRAFT_352391 [Mycena filopes]|nr:hypothetical protein C8R46DRAFT_352391 [Mycena filopes]
MSFIDRIKSSPLVLPLPRESINANLNTISLPLYTHAQVTAARDEDQYNHGSRILIGLKDYIFDVTMLGEFMGTGGSLSNFPWNDVSCALTRASNNPADTAIEGYSTLSTVELEKLDGWTSIFLRRFVVVGKFAEITT